MHDPGFRIEGAPDPMAMALAAMLRELTPACRTLVNADAVMECRIVADRCRAFAAHDAAGEGLIVTLLRAPATGLADAAAHEAAAALWAFTRVAALDWAPRRIRVNAIGLGLAPAGPFEPVEQAGRAAFPAAAAAASVADVARTIRAMTEWPSMTGQIIRLGV